MARRRRFARISQALAPARVQVVRVASSAGRGVRRAASALRAGVSEDKSPMGAAVHTVGAGVGGLAGLGADMVLDTDTKSNTAEDKYYRPAVKMLLAGVVRWYGVRKRNTMAVAIADGLAGQSTASGAANILQKAANKAAGKP